MSNRRERAKVIPTWAKKHEALVQKAMIDEKFRFKLLSANEQPQRKYLVREFGALQSA